MTCQMAGAPCPREAAIVVRIPGVGDRRLCGGCVDTLTRLGMAFRRLDDTAPLPAWRQRDLSRDMSRRRSAA